MSSNMARKARKETDLDPTDLFGRKVREPAGPVELALEVPPPRRVSLVAMRHEDKVVFDGLQAWLCYRTGRKHSQWDAMSVVLAAALGNPAGALAGFEA